MITDIQYTIYIRAFDCYRNQRPSMTLDTLFYCTKLPSWSPPGLIPDQTICAVLDVRLSRPYSYNIALENAVN